MEPMRIRCPVCRADNEWADYERPEYDSERAGRENCRRCRADLTLLVRVESKRDRILQLGHRALCDGDFRQAAHHARQAKNVRAGADANKLLALAQLLASDFTAAFQTHLELQP